MNENRFKYLKMPRDVSGFTSMKGVTDFSNLRQFDSFETGYPGLVVCGVPKFMETLASRNADVKKLHDGFVHILENEFRGLSGIPDVSATPGTVTNGYNELQIINNVEMDTSIQVSMSYFERSGGLLTRYINTFLTGIKDPYSKAKTYHGLIEDGIITDPGPMYEVFTFLYYVMDNTMRKIEKAYLLANCQMTTAPESTLYNAQKGDIQFPEIELSFNAFPIVGTVVNEMAYKYLHYQLDKNTPANKRLILDSNDFQYAIYGDLQADGSLIGNVLKNTRV